MKKIIAVCVIFLLMHPFVGRAQSAQSIETVSAIHWTTGLISANTPFNVQYTNVYAFGNPWVYVQPCFFISDIRIDTIAVSGSSNLGGYGSVTCTPNLSTPSPAVNYPISVALTPTPTGTTQGWFMTFTIGSLPLSCFVQASNLSGFCQGSFTDWNGQPPQTLISVQGVLTYSTAP